MAMPPQAQADNLNIIFLPHLVTSHMIPIVDMARVFAMHDVDVTIIATSGNAAIFQKSIDRDSNRGRSIKTHVLEFPAKQLGLPVGVESFNADTPPEMSPKIYEGLAILQPQIEKLFGELEADCIVSDMLHTWTVEAAAKLGIPRLVFSPGSILSRSAEHSLGQHPVYTKVKCDSEKFTIVGLPHQLQMTRLQVPHFMTKPDSYGWLMKIVNDETKRSYGAVFNSFYEFEGAYEEHYKNAYGTKCWSIGPVSLWVNQDASDKAERGHAKAEEVEGIMKWLNSKKENSVLYVSFGSIYKFPSSQLIEIAHALEASGHDFIWVVRKNNNNEKEGEGMMEEFEKRVKASNKGYLIWGWAPQLLIIENKAIGGVVTHCGWNTVIETINAGLPMVTWPLFSEHHFSEKLLVDVLRIGVPVGATEWINWNESGSQVVKREEIGKAIALVMDNGEEATEMRRKAIDLSLAAKKAINVGGSSHNNMIQLIQELKSLKLQRISVIDYGNQMSANQIHCSNRSNQ